MRFAGFCLLIAGAVVTLQDRPHWYVGVVTMVIAVVLLIAGTILQEDDE